jgi:hypothetical protein
MKNSHKTICQNEVKFNWHTAYPIIIQHLWHEEVIGGFVVFFQSVSNSVKVREVPVEVGIIGVGSSNQPALIGILRKRELKSSLWHHTK